MIKFSPVLGHISNAIERAIKIAEIGRDVVELEFNGDTVVVYAKHDDQVYAEWQAKREKRQAGNGSDSLK